MTNKNTSVGILGAGISGLSAAYALFKKGISITVYEKSAEPGGVIRSVKDNGWLTEEGPNTLMVKSGELRDLLSGLELDGELQEANPSAAKRYIVKGGRPVPLPLSPARFITTPLLSARAKLRLLKEPFIPPSVRNDESVASFMARRLGHEPLDYLVNPFVSGIYAGDPARLSVKHTFGSLWRLEQKYGSLLKGWVKSERPPSAGRKLVSFENGLQTLPLRLSDVISGSLHTSSEITSARKKEGYWEVKGVSKGSPFTRRHRCLISSLPAAPLAGIFESPLFEELQTLPYAPLRVICLGFRSGQIAHPLDGFGMLIPEAEGFKTLGVLFSSTLFPGRAPGGHKLLTCFRGGAGNREGAVAGEKEAEDQLLAELDRLLGISGEPVFVRNRYLPRAIPQYEVGHDYYVSLFLDIEKDNDGLFLNSSFRDGVSLPDRISAGFQTAQKAHAYCRSDR